MIQQAKETWTGRGRERTVTWHEIDKLPHIHFKLYPHDAMLRMIAHWEGGNLVVAVDGGNMTYYFRASTWAEIAQIVEHYIKPLTRPAGRPAMTVGAFRAITQKGA